MISDPQGAVGESRQDRRQKRAEAVLLQAPGRDPGKEDPRTLRKTDRKITEDSFGMGEDPHVPDAEQTVGVQKKVV